jgi:hypothetical protein
MKFGHIGQVSARGFERQKPPGEPHNCAQGNQPCAPEGTGRAALTSRAVVVFRKSCNSFRHNPDFKKYFKPQ